MIRWLASASCGAASATTLGNRSDVRVEIARELRVAAAREDARLDALVAVGHVHGQQVADVGTVDDTAAASGLTVRPQRTLELTQAQRPVIPVGHRVDERLALGVAVLAEQVHLVPEAHQRRRELGVVDVRAGPLEQVTVEDQHAHARAAYPRPHAPVKLRP